MASKAFCVGCGVAGRMCGAMVVVVCAAWLSCAVAAESRTWSDKSGKFKIEAKFVELSDGKVTLQREDGSQVRIALDKLSDEDQKIAKESGEASPFETVKPAAKPGKSGKSAKKIAAEEGAEGEGEGTEGEGGEGQNESGQGEPKIVAPNWSGANEILAAPNNDKWSITVEAVEQPETPKKGRPIALPSKADFFEGLKGIAVNPVCGRAVLGYVLDRPGGAPAVPTPPPAQPGRGTRPARPARPAATGTQSRLVLCDLQNSKMLGQATVSAKMAPLALSDDGKQVLMRRDEFGFGNADRLEIWQLTKGGINRQLQWAPHDQEQGPARDVHWAAFIDDKRIATLGGGGKLTVWQLAGAKPLYFVKIQGNCRPALSPDRKYIAFATDKGVGLLDLAAGEVAVMQAAPREHFPFPVMAFSPTGKRFACAAFDRIYVWDTATGTLYRDISLTGAAVHIAHDFFLTGDNYALVGKSLLVDLEMQAKVWSYSGHEAAQGLGPVCWMAISPHGNTGALVPTTLPHPTAAEHIKRAMQTPDFFVLKPGVTVSVNLAGLPDPAEREKVGAALMQKLQANGFQVAPNGTIELAATCEMGKRRDVSYHTFGAFGDRTYSVQEYISRLRFVYQGQPAWEVSASSVPGFVSLKQGETMEQVLRNSERPNYAWFASADLPKMLQKPGQGGATLGTSQVSTAGIQ